MVLFHLSNLRNCMRLGSNALVQSFRGNVYAYNYSTNEIKLCGIVQHAGFCSDSKNNLNKRRRSMPSLMKFPEIVWPSFLNSFRNWVLINFVIRPYFDNDFTLKDFICGAKQAVHVISSQLVSSNLLELRNLVSPDVIEEIKPALEKMSVFQRKQLEINKNDIFLSFPYQVGIMFDESKERKQKRFVEITMVFHVFRGFKEMQKQGEILPWNMGSMPEYEDNVFICNYRFIKEFTVGSETDWMVNIINHFKPGDLLLDEEK